MYNKDFDKKQVAFLYKQGEDYIQQIEQWKRYEHWDIVAEYNYKLATIVELLESIFVFYHGDGIYGFKHGNKTCTTIKDRFLSFKQHCK